MSRNIYKIILIVSSILIVVSSVNIFLLTREYQKGINEYKSLEQYVTVVEKEPEVVKSEEPKAKDVEEETEVVKESVIPIHLDIDFQALKEINPEVVGWIYYEPFETNYPIVRGTDNEYYTNYTYERVANPAGAIFLEYLNKPDFSNYNTIIYGHNMRNGTMFGSLKKFLTDESIIEKNPYFYVFTETQAFMYEIAAVYVTDYMSDTYNLIKNEEEQAEYIKYIDSVATWKWDKEIHPQDKIATMSTCHGLHGNNRTVVHGVLIAQEDRQ